MGPFIRRQAIWMADWLPEKCVNVFKYYIYYYYIYYYIILQLQLLHLSDNLECLLPASFYYI
jgi:hypothetical protein